MGLPRLQAAADSIKRWRGKQLHDWRAAKGSKDWQRLQRELHRFFAVHCVLHKSGECLGLSLPQFSALMKLTRIADEELPLEVRGSSSVFGGGGGGRGSDAECLLLPWLVPGGCMAWPLVPGICYQSRNSLSCGTACWLLHCCGWVGA